MTQASGADPRLAFGATTRTGSVTLIAVRAAGPPVFAGRWEKPLMPADLPAQSLAGTKLVIVPAVPDWLVPPYEGWHFEDLLALPLDGSQHIELIDGAFIPMGPPSKFHVQVIRNLQAQLDRQCPAGLRADSEMTVRIDDDNGPETDVLVVTASAYDEQEQATWYDGSDVIMAVEVVSPSSRVRDRERKPQIYAKAAVKYLWRIENDDDSPVIYTSQLDAASAAYDVTGIFHHRLKLSVPFPIDLDLGELTE